MEEFSRKHVQRLRRENNNEVALVEKETKEEEGVLLSETCRVLIERIHNNQSTTCRKRLKRRKHLKIPEYIANRAAISLYRSMVLEPDVEEGGEEMPTRSIKYYASEKYNKLKDQLLSNELKEDMESGRYLLHLSALSGIGDTLESWRLSTREATANLDFNIDTSATDTIARLARELEERRESSTEALSAFYEVFPSHQPGDYVRSLSAALQV